MQTQNKLPAHTIVEALENFAGIWKSFDDESFPPFQVPVTIDSCGCCLDGFLTKHEGDYLIQWMPNDGESGGCLLVNLPKEARWLDPSPEIKEALIDALQQKKSDDQILQIDADAAWALYKLENPWYTETGSYENFQSGFIAGRNSLSANNKEKETGGYLQSEKEFQIIALRALGLDYEKLGCTFEQSINSVIHMAVSAKQELKEKEEKIKLLEQEVNDRNLAMTSIYRSFKKVEKTPEQQRVYDNIEKIASKWFNPTSILR